MKPLKYVNADNLKVQVYRNDKEMGQAAAHYVQKILKETIELRGRANIIFATGASQFTFYENLRLLKDIAWDKVTVFHLDEYANMPDNHPSSFRKYLNERILQHIDPAAVHLLHGDAPDLDAETRRYESLLKEVEIDLACIGIGENGHIAFNDPPVADFNDPRLVKLVELDMGCRKQQFGEGWFNTIEEVPTHALSLTIPAIMRSGIISCVVPDDRKAKAVHEAVKKPIATSCPASILRTHKNCTLFLDQNSAHLL